MKRFFSCLFASLFLLLPLTANAVPVYVGSGTLDASFSGPTGGGYYLDYDGKASIPSRPDIIFSDKPVDIFCVSPIELDTDYRNYDFYRFESPLAQNQSKATWIADNWIYSIDLNTPGRGQDDVKGEAQKAIWALWGVMDISILGAINDGLDWYFYNNADANYVSQNWLWAKSQSGSNQGPLSQDYLVPFSSGGNVPAPEPSTLILLGLGLAGIGAYRKFRS